jgi:hypothetical protein
MAIPAGSATPADTGLWKLDHLDGKSGRRPLKIETAP